MLFNPFWAACSTAIMGGASNLGVEGYASFSETCQSTALIATGFAHRGVCDDSNYDVREADMLSVCCVDREACHPKDHSGLPARCSLECAVIFSEFYEDCVHEIGAAPGLKRRL